MVRLTEILGEDLKNVGALSLGLVRGIYTPFLLATGIRQVSNYNIIEKERDSLKMAGHIGGLAGMMFGCGFFFAFHQREKEYLLALLASNVVDYAVETYRRVKQKNPSE